MHNDSSNLSSRCRRGGALVARKALVCFDAVDEASARVIHALWYGLWWVLSKVPFMGRLADKVCVSDADLSDQDRADRSRYRRSNGWAIFLHIFVIFILPWLLGLSFKEYMYGIPKGSGEQTPEPVKVVKVKKIKKKFVLNPNSAIIWEVPVPDDEVLEDLIEERVVDGDRHRNLRLCEPRSQPLAEIRGKSPGASLAMRGYGDRLLVDF